MEAIAVSSDWVTTGLSAVVILLASVVHGIAGFGFAQVSMGIMPLFRSPASASIIFTATAVVSNGRVWWSVRDAFDWRKWIVPVGGLVVGMPLGIVVFSGFNEAQMRVAIGAVLVLAVVVVGATQQLDVVTDWIEESDYRPGNVIGATAGLLAGILGGAVAEPGDRVVGEVGAALERQLREGSFEFRRGQRPEEVDDTGEFVGIERRVRRGRRHGRQRLDCLPGGVDQQQRLCRLEHRLQYLLEALPVQIRPGNHGFNISTSVFNFNDE